MMLNANRTLKLLNLSGCGLTSEVATSLANGLAQNCSLINVVLHSNNIGSIGAVNIFRSLEHDTRLDKLDLSKNWELVEGDSEAVGCAIERMLNVNRTLKVLHLSACKVRDPIVKHILTGLTKNTSFLTLDIGSCTLSGSCAVSLFQQVTACPTCTLRIHVPEVDVVGVGRVKMDKGTIWCAVSDTVPENCMDLFRALNENVVKVSNLIVQDLTDKTAQHFAAGLAESQSLQALKVKHCNISSAGAVSLFRSLEYVQHQSGET